MTLEKKPRIVVKLGGAALLGDAGRRLFDRLATGTGAVRLALVVSAMRGVTDRLLELARRRPGDAAGVRSAIDALLRDHDVAASHLLAATHRRFEKDLAEAGDALERLVTAAMAAPPDSDDGTAALIASYGEGLALRMAAAALEDRGRQPMVLDATRLIVVDAEASGPRVDFAATDRHLAAYRDVDDTLAMAGFLAGDRDGRTTLLGRNASDWSAAIMARGLGARTLEIRTDVPGILTADPRVVAAAAPIGDLTHSEAEALAAAGAKVLHPETLSPLRGRAVEVRVRGIDPDSSGTRILERLDDLADGPIAVCAAPAATGRDARVTLFWRGGLPATAAPAVSQSVAAFSVQLTASPNGPLSWLALRVSEADLGAVARAVHHAAFGF